MQHPDPADLPPYDYTYEEFEADLLHFLRVAITSPEVVSIYFQRKYLDGGEGAWKMNRLVAARQFIELNRGKFGEFYLESETGGKGQITNHLVGALGKVFTFTPDRFAIPTFPLEIILQIAKECKDDGNSSPHHQQ